MMTYIEELQDVIRHRHGVESRHAESVPVKETFEGKTIWEGTVEVFELIGHPKAPKVYAWAYETDNPKKPRHVTVLHLGTATSPLLAVQAAIVEEFRNSQTDKA
jgi:hypothetical protein